VLRTDGGFATDRKLTVSEDSGRKSDWILSTKIVRFLPVPAKYLFYSAFPISSAFLPAKSGKPLFLRQPVPFGLLSPDCHRFDRSL
jgi:hypothetical protein